MPQPSSTFQRQLFILYLLAILAAGKVIQPCLDWDTWWHLAVGRYIVVEHQLPAEDPFSQVGREEHTPWIAYSWLYELLLYAGLKVGGVAGVLALRYAFVMLSWGGIAYFLLEHARKRWLALVLLALISISLRPFSMERPWHFTIFFTTLTLHASIRVREGAPWRRYAWLPLLYVIWANIHIQFVMGFAVLGLAWLSSLVERLRGGDQSSGTSARGMFLLGLTCAAATLATPFHYHLYQVIREYATQTKALELVTELRPPDYSQWYNWPLLGVLFVAAILTIRRGLRLWDVLMLAAAIVFSARMQRDLWFGILAASAVIIDDREKTSSVPVSPFAPWMIAATAAAAVLLVSVMWELGLSQGKTTAQTHAQTFPVQAAEYVRDHELPGPLFNHFDWGGYLIWALPGHPVAIDGRTNLYGNVRLEQSYNVWNGNGWESFEPLRRAGVIIAPAKQNGDVAPLTKILREHPERWLVAYEDETAIVFTPMPVEKLQQSTSGFCP